MNQKIKNYLGIALILGTLAVAYAGIEFAVSYPPYPGRTFSVSGQGEVVAIPDVGRFSFSVLTEGGTNLQELQSKNTEKSNAVIAFLKGKGIEERDIKSDSYNIYPKYSDCKPYGCPQEQITGYEVEHFISVTVRNLDDFGTLLTGVVEKGTNTVSTITFEVDNLDKVKDEARIAAIADAKTRAEVIAKAGGFRIGQLVSLYTSSPEPYYGYDGDRGYSELAKDAGYVSPQLEPGSQKVTVTVDISYEIK